MASCSADISSEKKADNGTVLGDSAAVGRDGWLVSAHRVEGDVGGKCSLAHRRAAGKDHQIRGVQAAEFVVEIDKAGGDADGLAAFLERRLGAVDGARQCGAKGEEATFALSRGCEIEQLFLGAFDLLGGAVVEILAEGIVDHIFAERDQLTPQVKVVDVTAVILGIDDRYCRTGEHG